MGKWIVAVLAVLLLLAGGGFWYASANLDRWVKDAIEQYGSEYTGVRVTVEGVALSPFGGRGEIRGLEVGQPEGYEGDYAIRVGSASVNLRLMSLLEDPLVIDRVIVDGARVNAVSRDLRDTNLQVILRHVESMTPPREQDDEASGRQLIIEQFDLTDTEATVVAGDLGGVGVRVPDLELTGLGRETAGASVGQVLQQILQPLVGAVVTSITEGRVRELLDEQGEALRDRLREEADGLRDRVRGLFQSNNDD